MADGILDKFKQGIDDVVSTGKEQGANISAAWQSDQQNLNRSLNVGKKTNITDMLIKEPKILAEHILKRPAIGCSLTMPDPVWTKDSVTGDTTTIPFYMTQDFSFGIGNEWTQFADPSGFLGPLKTAFDTLGAFNGQSQLSMQSQAMSTAVWKGSTFEGFNLNGVIVCTNRQIDPSALIFKLCKSCLPIKRHKFEGTVAGTETLQAVGIGANKLGGSLLNMFTLQSFKDQIDSYVNKANEFVKDLGMVAPHGYGVTIDDQNEGSKIVTPLPGTTCTLTIGDWFQADNLIVDKISSITFSKEVIAPPTSNSNKRGNDIYHSNAEDSPSGFPLYATFTISLKPYCMVDLDMFQGYFLTANKFSKQTIDNWSSKNLQL